MRKFGRFGQYISRLNSSSKMEILLNPHPSSPVGIFGDTVKLLYNLTSIPDRIPILNAVRWIHIQTNFQTV